MTTIKNRFKLHYVFFRSVLVPSVAIGVLLGLFAAMSRYTLAVPSIAELSSFVPFGLVLSLAYKEIAHKEEYYFYFNQGITRVELWIVSLFLVVSFCIVFNLIVALCRIAWKWIVL